MKEKKINDGVIYDRKFTINHNIDKQLLDPNLKLKFGNNEFSMAEINNIIPSTEKKIDMFIEWDNMCQYMAIGLTDKINEIIKENRKFDLNDFLNRENYPNGIDYVKYKIFPDLKPELIDGVMSKYYTDIMSRSPITDFFRKINLLKFMLNSVTFMFRYNIDENKLEEFISEIASEKFNNDVSCQYVIYPTEEVEIEAIKTLKLKELYIVPDMGLYYETMMENEKECTNIISYDKHHGVNPYILAYYFNDFIVNGLEGPNNITLSFIQELKNKEEKDDEK